MSVCTHDKNCSGFGWMHNEQITPTQREELGLPPEGELSMKNSKRVMRAYRKGWGDGYSLGIERGIALSKLTTQNTEEETE